MLPIYPDIKVFPIVVWNWTYVFLSRELELSRRHFNLPQSGFPFLRDWCRFVTLAGVDENMDRPPHAAGLFFELGGHQILQFLCPGMANDTFFYTLVRNPSSGKTTLLFSVPLGDSRICFLWEAEGALHWYFLPVLVFSIKTQKNKDKILSN